MDRQKPQAARSARNPRAQSAIDKKGGLWGGRVEKDQTPKEERPPPSQGAPPQARPDDGENGDEKRSIRRFWHGAHGFGAVGEG